MDCPSFIQTTITNLDPGLFCGLRDVLLDQFLKLSIAKKEDLTAPILGEKLCDYFEKIELKGMPFEKVVDKYVEALDSVVGERIAEKPKQKKNKPTPPTPRARKYYDHACFLKQTIKESNSSLLDYTRIMLCLYSAIVGADLKQIVDFDLSISGLNLAELIKALRKETTGFVNKRPRFETGDPYVSDKSTFVLLVILFFYMKNNEVEGEY